MALRPCKECYQGISSHAKVCPHCGRKNPRQGKISFAIDRFSTWLIKVGLVLLLLWFIVAMLLMI